MWVISRSFPERKYIPFLVVHSNNQGVTFSSLKISKYKTNPGVAFSSLKISQYKSSKYIAALNAQPATMLNILASSSFRIAEASNRILSIRYSSQWITNWQVLVAAGRQLLQRDRRPWSCSTSSFSPWIFHATTTSLRRLRRIRDPQKRFATSFDSRNSGRF